MPITSAELSEGDYICASKNAAHTHDLDGSGFKRWTCAQTLASFFSVNFGSSQKNEALETIW